MEHLRLVTIDLMQRGILLGIAGVTGSEILIVEPNKGR